MMDMSQESEFYNRMRPAADRLRAAAESSAHPETEAAPSEATEAAPGEGGIRVSQSEGGFVCEKTFLDGQFLARIWIPEEGPVRGEVIDLDTGEEYLPIRSRNQIGGFVGTVREAYREVLKEIGDAFFLPVHFIWDQSNRIAEGIRKEWGVEPSFPWERDPGSGTFSCRENGRWFGVLLPVAFGKLRAPEESAGPARDREELVEVINLKGDPDRIPELTKTRGIYPAWHMNKTHWISVILDDTLTDDQVMELIRESHRLVTEKHRGSGIRSGAWMIPSNPKIYDVDAGFAGGATIDWHQHNDIREGDEVFIYSAAPNSAIMYRCRVEAANLPYDGMFRESRGYERSMRISLVEKYPPDRFPLSFLKANGGSVVRSARSMPPQLYEAILRDLRED